MELKEYGKYAYNDGNDVVVKDDLRSNGFNPVVRDTIRKNKTYREMLMNGGFAPYEQRVLEPRHELKYASLKILSLFVTENSDAATTYGITIPHVNETVEEKIKAFLTKNGIKFKEYVNTWNYELRISMAASNFDRYKKLADKCWHSIEKKIKKNNMKLSKNIVISDKTVKIVDSKKYGGFVGLINKLQEDFAANGFADDSINYKIWAINTEANFPEQHMAYSHWDGILNEPVMSMQAITKVSNETVKMFADAFAANKSTRGYSMFLGGEIGTKVRALLGNCGIMLSNEYRLFIDNTDFYIGSFDIKRGIYFTDVFEIADNNPTWRMVSSYFYDKGIQFYSLGGAKWFGAFNRIEDFNEFWKKLGVYDIESFEPLTDKAKELFSANTEVAVEDDPSKPSEETYTILKRFDLLDREPKFYYMLLGRLQQDCNYLIDSSHSADTLWAHDIDDQINLMYALYDIVPEKPQWITIDEIAELEDKMKAATGETDEDEANLFDDYTGICLVSEDDGH